MNRICVLGLGYIGLPTASVLATHGFEVVGVDVNAQEDGWERTRKVACPLCTCPLFKQLRVVV